MSPVWEYVQALKDRVSPVGILPAILSAASMPVVLLLSVPLAALAVITTTFAFWILLARVSLVYVEIFAALLRAYIVPSSEAPLTRPSPAGSPDKQLSPRSRQPSRNSSDSLGVQVQVLPHNASSATLAEPLPDRDYEGVGGWRVQDDDEDDALYMGMNSRLEFPLATPRYARSQASLSRPPSGFASPERVRTPLAVRTATPGRHRRLESGSPEGYFNMPLTPVGVGDRNSKVSFGDTRTDGSSAVSLSSVKVVRQDPA